MANYFLTDDAAEDLAFLYREGMDRFGDHQADQYLDEFYHLFDLLADNPMMGIDFDVLGKRMQRHPHKAHVIVFEPVEAGVKILRVFYGGSDYFKEL